MTQTVRLLEALLFLAPCVANISDCSGLLAAVRMNVSLICITSAN